MNNNEILCIVCSDIHLSPIAPTCRSEEPDWLAAQERQFHWLQELQKKYRVPIFIAGDLFDRAIYDIPSVAINCHFSNHVDWL
jgi:DNA repair exonuclease SbcCD nuclease subunit